MFQASHLTLYGESQPQPVRRQDQHQRERHHDPEPCPIRTAPSSRSTHFPKLRPPKDSVTILSVGGLSAALLASVCCIGPLVFAALGVGVGATGFLAGTAGFLKGLLPYRPAFIGLTILLLGVSFYLAYGKPKSAVCAPGRSFLARTHGPHLLALPSTCAPLSFSKLLRIGQ